MDYYSDSDDSRNGEEKIINTMTTSVVTQSSMNTERTTISGNRLAESLIDEFKEAEGFINFLMDNANDLSSTLRDNGIFAVNGAVGEPAVIMGFIPGRDVPIMQYNLYGILADLISIHGDRLFQSSDTFDQYFDEYIRRLQTEANAIFHNRGTDNIWRSDAENVHDNSVNIAYKRSYDKIITANKKLDKEFYLANVRSYYYQKGQELNIELAQYSQCSSVAKQFVSYFKSKTSIDLQEIEVFVDQVNKMLLVLNSGIERIEYIQKEIGKLSKILWIINYIEKHNEYMATVNAKEVDVLLNIWKRIHSPVNDENREHLLSLLTSELLTLVADHKEEGIECLNGRIGAMISALELYDADQLVTIKCVPALRVMIVQDRAPQLINEFLNPMILQLSKCMRRMIIMIM